LSYGDRRNAEMADINFTEPCTAEIDGKEFEYSLKIYSVSKGEITGTVYYKGFSESISKVCLEKDSGCVAMLKFHADSAFRRLYASLPKLNEERKDQDR
jgi:hypothetical protein